jgi:DNA-binding CsgD family transcriptional regulator
MADRPVGTREGRELVDVVVQELVGPQGCDGRLARLAPHLAAGLRTALLLDHVDAVPAEDGPGLIVLAEDLTVVATTAAAERWLAELQDWPRRRDLPNAVLVLAARLRSLERDGGPHVLPRARVRTPSGRWLVLHAARLAGAEGAGAIAIITEVARPAEIAPLILQAYGLTEREAQIAGLVLRGAATREIAASLAVAAATVQQHLKAIFDKTGVRSRRELVAQIFGQQYAPRLVAGAALGADEAGGVEAIQHRGQGHGAPPLGPPGAAGGEEGIGLPCRA